MLTWLEATRFRNLNKARLDFSPGLNLIFGANGSGKTSILESCYFLSQARSFRSASLSPIIQKDRDDFLLRGEVREGVSVSQIGMSRNRDGQRVIRVNEEDVRKASELAKILPVLLLGPESVNLLIGPPGLRRRFLNWGLFHVEPGFAHGWQEANRCLQQRNSLLRKNHANREELDTWTHQLVEAAEVLDRYRLSYVDRYLPIFQQMMAELTGRDDLRFEYHRGWSRDSELAALYEKDRPSDQKKGFTQKGFQRADVRIQVAGVPATQVCSRGELKSLVWGMVIAQGRLAEQSAAGRTLYLVDDLGSEFDKENRVKLCDLLTSSGQQVILTGVERESLLSACSNKYGAMFHVEHGAIEEIK
ncbi:MAG: DNA replication and repair protein RecF [Candidatus Azotimanducaceae bacterium]|jgi:DNA replication and repair protein RecF